MSHQDRRAALAATFGPGPHWYIVQSKQHRETVARDALLARGFEAYLPLVRVERMVSGRNQISAVPMFTRFLFVRAKLLGEHWRFIFTAHGVKCVLGVGEEPSIVADSVIQTARQIEADGFSQFVEGVAGEVTGVRMYRDSKRGMTYEFRAGDQLTVKRGPLAGLQALAVRDVKGGRNSVLLQLLDDSARLARVEMSIDDVHLTPEAA